MSVSAVDELREPYSPGSVERAEYGFDAAMVGRHGPDSVATGGGSRDWQPSPLGKLPGSVWRIPTEPLKVPEHLGVDHFAAFPSEWPRRLILGWSPPGWCTACGEPRRPMVTSERMKDGEPLGDRAQAFAPPSEPRRTPNGDGGHWRFSTETAITGYASACPDTTAPTIPAVVLDPFGGTGTTAMVARALGRTGISLDLSADYCRLAQWRIFDSGHGAKARVRSDRERQEALL